MAGRFKLPQWVYPLVIAALVAVFGWWGNYRLRDTIEQELKTQLTAALDANVTALEIWTTNQLKLASSLAADPVVRDFGSAILEQPPQGFFSQTTIDAQQLANYLRSRLNSMGYETAQLVNKNFAVVATSSINRLAEVVPVSDALTNKFYELFATKRPVLITPFKPELRSQPPGRVLRYNISERGGRLVISSDVQTIQVGAAGAATSP